MIKNIISWTLRNIPRKYIQLVGHFATKTYVNFKKGLQVFNFKVHKRVRIVS